MSTRKRKHYFCIYANIHIMSNETTNDKIEHFYKLLQEMQALSETIMKEAKSAPKPEPKPEANPEPEAKIKKAQEYYKYLKTATENVEHFVPLTAPGLSRINVSEYCCTLNSEAIINEVNNEIQRTNILRNTIIKPLTTLGSNSYSDAIINEVNDAIQRTNAISKTSIPPLTIPPKNACMWSESTKHLEEALMKETFLPSMDFVTYELP